MAHRRYQQRRNRNNGLIIGIVISLAVAAAGITFFMMGGSVTQQTSYVPALQNQVNQISSQSKTVLDTVTTDTNKVGQMLHPIQNTQIPNDMSKPAPDQSSVTYNFDELSIIALDDINKYRGQNNLSALTMDNSQVSQAYASQLLSEGCLQHIEDDGVTPQGRFHQAGDDLFLIGENLAGGGLDNGDAIGFIHDQNYQMMFNDASSNWGHRQNILNPSYTEVSFGLAWNSGNMVMVEDFKEPLQGNEYIPSSDYVGTPSQKECW